MPYLANTVEKNSLRLKKHYYIPVHFDLSSTFDLSINFTFRGKSRNRNIPRKMRAHQRHKQDIGGVHLLYIAQGFSGKKYEVA